MDDQRNVCLFSHPVDLDKATACPVGWKNITHMGYKWVSVGSQTLGYNTGERDELRCPDRGCLTFSRVSRAVSAVKLQSGIVRKKRGWRVNRCCVFHRMTGSKMTSHKTEME